METQFVKIPRKFLELKEGTKFYDILIYAAIEYQKDGSKETSTIGMRTIASKYNIPLSKVEESIKRLVSKGFLKYTQYPSMTNDYVYNEYSFPYKDNKKGFLMLDPEVMVQELKPKDRGFLIYLQLLALPLMNEIEYKKMEDIAEALNITRQTASKYIKKFLELEQIKKWRDFYVCKYLIKE